MYGRRHSGKLGEPLYCSKLKVVGFSFNDDDDEEEGKSKVMWPAVGLAGLLGDRKAKAVR